MSKRKGSKIQSKLGEAISQKYQGIRVSMLKRMVRDKGLEYDYKDFNCATRDRLILALELSKWPSPEELEDAIQSAEEWDAMDKAKVEKPVQTETAPRTQAESINWDALPILLTPDQVQKLLQISRTTFFRMVKRGGLAGAMRVGYLWRVDRDKLRVDLQQTQA